MPINATKFTVNAEIDFEKVGLPKPAWDWETSIEVKVNNLILSSAECAEIQNAVTKVLAKHMDEFKAFGTHMTPLELETKDEREAKKAAEEAAKAAEEAEEDTEA